MRQIIVIAHNLRSSHNVGSLFRTADGLGVKKLYLTGYTPYPLSKKDKRLPHLALKTHKQIAKTALGAEQSLAWATEPDIYKLIDKLRLRGYVIMALEQTPNSQPLDAFQPPDKLAIVLGREVEGLEPEVIAKCQVVVDILMKGQKESFNVVVAAAIAVHYCSNSL